MYVNKAYSCKRKISAVFPTGLLPDRVAAVHKTVLLVALDLESIEKMDNEVKSYNRFTVSGRIIQRGRQGSCLDDNI